MWRAEVTLGKGNPHYDENEAWVSALIVPSPARARLYGHGGHATGAIEAGPGANYSTALARSLAALWPALLVVTLLAAALAWYCFRRHRRCCQSFERRMAGVRSSLGRSRSGGLSLPSPLAGPGEVSGLWARGPARQRNLCSLRGGVSAAGTQGLRSVRLKGAWFRAGAAFLLPRSGLRLPRRLLPPGVAIVRGATEKHRAVWQFSAQ